MCFFRSNKMESEYTIVDCMINSYAVMGGGGEEKGRKLALSREKSKFAFTVDYHVLQ